MQGFISTANTCFLSTFNESIKLKVTVILLYLYTFRGFSYKVLHWDRSMWLDPCSRILDVGLGHLPLLSVCLLQGICQDHHSHHIHHPHAGGARV